MGWGNCGDDSLGRPIGYMNPAICDHPNCLNEIDRGLSYACGGMHGELGGQACEKYFCTDHLFYVDHEAMGFDELSVGQLCSSCYEDAKNYISEAILSGDAKIVWKN